MSVPLNLKTYEVERAALIEKDRSLRREYARIQISSAEREADKVVRRVREEEARSIWSADYDGVPHPFPGMEFLTGMHMPRRAVLGSGAYDILFQGARSS